MTEIIEDRSLRNKTSVFRDRSNAGELLSEWLEDYREKDACVLAIPAGGVPVGVEISKRLNLPLDLAIVRKIHIPWNREAGFGAVTWDGIILLNEDLVKHLRLSKKEIDDCIAEEREEIEERVDLFGCGKFPEIVDKTVILVDDGLASGFTMLAAVYSVRRRNPKELVVAVPTSSLVAIGRIENHVDKIICLNIRTGPIFAVAEAYEQWYDLEDEEVLKFLRSAEWEV